MYDFVMRTARSMKLMSVLFSMSFFSSCCLLLFLCAIFDHNSSDRLFPKINLKNWRNIFIHSLHTIRTNSVSSKRSFTGFVRLVIQFLSDSPEWNHQVIEHSMNYIVQWARERQNECASIIITATIAWKSLSFPVCVIEFDFQLRDFRANNNPPNGWRKKTSIIITNSSKKRRELVEFSKNCEFIASKFIMLNINFGKCVTGNDLESDLFIFCCCPDIYLFWFRTSLSSDYELARSNSLIQRSDAQLSHLPLDFGSEKKEPIAIHLSNHWLSAYL